MNTDFAIEMRRKAGLAAWWPKSVLARLAIILTVFVAVLSILRRLVPSQSVPLAIAFTFVVIVLLISLAVLFLRWVRHTVMWRLRNRLIVTYVFIGVIPILLLLAMGFIAAYLFAGQFSTFVVTADLSSELRRIETANSTIAANIASQVSEAPGKAPTTRFLLDEPTQHEFPERQVTVRVADNAAVPLSSLIATIKAQPITAPDYTTDKPNFGALVLDDDKMYLRAVSTRQTSRGRVTVISSVPVTPMLLSKMVQGLGVVTLLRPDRENQQNQSGLQVNLGSGGSVVSLKNSPESSVSAGELRAKQGRMDMELNFGTALAIREWGTGKARTGLLVVQTRPSLLYERLFRTLGEYANFVFSALVAVAIFFALIELLALFAGVRLTQTMTQSVASLYDATQHVNAGNLSHRIEVKSKDQLAALEHSFNSMTGSLQQLLAEQQEKQRIESELMIAQEVQALLFPRDITEVETLEVHGICRPARTVSGDYYDFLPVGPNRLGLAVGDISGKGISAALLMATVHAFVRAYTLVEKAPMLAAPVAAGAASSVTHDRRKLQETLDLPPGTLMAMLNQQLYQSTPTEKYATMFLGFYDARTRELTYANAGHLPPILVGRDGSVRSLETGGLVVGLFGDVTYEDAAIQMEPGDIFIAYSDGVTEPENEFGEFGEDRLIQIVKDNRHLPLARISDIVMGAVNDWIGAGEQPDDVTLVLARSR